jgi:biotin carboxyl carrier protein
MKLKAQLSEQEHRVSLNVADGKVDVTVDDRHYDLQVHELTRGEYLLFDGSKVYQCRVSGAHEAPSADQSFEVVLRGRSYEVALLDPRRLRSATTAGGLHTGAAEIVSPMPGKIVKILVEPGAEIEAGAGVVVVEAMKMQNEMKAPKGGTVVAIAVAEGATVNAGDVLAVIE